MQYQRSPDIQESKVGDRLILYHGKTMKAIVINPAGSLLWDGLAHPQSINTLAEKLRQRFRALSSEQALTDASLFLNHLLEHDLITPQEETMSR